MESIKIKIIIIILFVACTNFALASLEDDIKKANKKGQVIFLAVTEKGNSENQIAINLAKKAQKSYSKSAVFELERSNAVNKELVKKYRLAGAPIPLVLVISRNGYVTGGAPLENLTADVLVKMVPTPKEEGVIKAINEGKSVFVVFTKKSDSKNKKQMDACLSACQKMENKAKMVNVDVDDKNEKSFIAKFNLDKNIPFPTTYVVNTQGQVTSMLNGITEAKDLVTAATKKVSSGCCPPGGGKTCK